MVDSFIHHNDNLKWLLLNSIEWFTNRVIYNSLTFVIVSVDTPLTCEINYRHHK